MDILIVYPEKADVVTGNSCSAEQWRGVLLALGHKVELSGHCNHANADLLVALNAEKMHPEIEAFSRRNPRSKIAVILTGTDIYPAASELSLHSMQMADRLVVLQGKAIDRVPVEFHDKVQVIVQAVIPSRKSVTDKMKMNPEAFNVAVVANLRGVKDPFLAATAARLMPGESRLYVRHAGFPLDCGSDEHARKETAGNSRYEWLGGLNPADSRELISRSDVLLVTSKNEGAGRVIGEAITDDTPVIATRVEGITGLVGDDYAGLFPAGDAMALAALLTRVENKNGFLDELSQGCRQLVPVFVPAVEVQSWKKLIAGLA